MKRFLIILAIIIVGVAAFFGFRQFRQSRLTEETLANLQTESANIGLLTATVGATGIVRSDQSAILTWQTTGTVEQVNVQVGDQVVVDQLLVTLKQSSLAQNIIFTQADLVSARRALDDLLKSDIQRAQALQALEDAEQNLEDLLNSELQQALAQEAIVSSEKAIELVEKRLDILQSTADQADIDAAQAQVILARDALDKAQEKFDPYENKPESNLTRAVFQSQLAAAQQSYDFAVRQYNGMQSTGDATDIAVTEADLQKTQAQLLDAQREWERVKDGPSPARIALLEAQIADAQREWERLKDGPDPDDIAAAEARIAASEATINLARINAPFDGKITQLSVKPGDQVAPGLVAFRLDDLSRLLVDVDVSEVDINNIEVGQDVTLNFDAILTKEYQGRVVEVGAVGNAIQGVVSFNVTVELLDADEQVRPGMTAGVNIVVSELGNALLVPNRAVRLKDGVRVVYILKPGEVQPEAVEIELGASSEIYSQVVSGELRQGDEVLLNPPSDFASFFGGGPPPGMRQ